MRRFAVLMGLALAAVGMGQGTPAWLRNYPAKIFRGAQLQNLRENESNGRIEIQVDVPVSANDLLAARLRAPHLDRAEDWTLLVVRGDRVNRLGVEEVRLLPREGPFNRVRLRASVPAQYATRDAKYYFSVDGRDLQNDVETNILFGDAALTAVRTPSVLTSFSLQPAYTNIEGSSRQWVLEAPIRLGFPRPFGEGGSHPIHAELFLVPSTQLRDPNSGLTATIGQEDVDVFQRSNRVPYLRRQWGIRYRTNAQLTNRKTGAFYSFELPLTSYAVDPGVGVRGYAPASLRLGLLSVEYRERIDRGINPHHTATFLANPWAQLALPPLYLSGGEHPSPYRNPYLTFSAKGWAFPFEEATGGYSVRRFEGRFDIELTYPLPSLMGQAIILGYHNGANENDNYFRQTALSLEFRIFGRKTSVYRTGD